MENILKELEPLKKALGFKKVSVHFISGAGKGTLALYAAGTTDHPHFLITTRVIYYTSKKYGVNLGTAIFTTLVHEFCHAILRNEGY